jgi:hypothetical protein
MLSDCLVLKINNFSQELYVESNATVYIIYDIKTELFVISGKIHGGVEFNYNADSAKAVEVFISFIFSDKQKVTYTIFNHARLPYEQEEINYENLNNSLFENVYEIAYKIEKLNYSKKRVKNILSMLKHIFNFY